MSIPGGHGIQEVGGSITQNVPLNLLRSEGMSKASMPGSSVGSVANVLFGYYGVIAARLPI